MDEKNIQVTTNSGKTFDFHKIFAAIGLILVVMIIIVSGIWYFVEGKNTQLFNDEENTIKVSTNSAKTSTKTSEKISTEGWKLVTNTDLNYSIRYPKTWIMKQCSKEGVGGVDADMFGSIESEAGACGSGNLPTVFITNGDFSSTVDSSFESYKTEEVEIAGKTVTKVSGVTKSRPDIIDGVYSIDYIFSDKSLFVQFKGKKTDTDKLTVLEQMLTTIKFLD